MAPTPVDAKIDECKTEIHRMMTELEERIESLESIHSLIANIHTSTKHTEERVNNILVSFSAYAAKSEALVKGFPDGDADGHRRAHEAWIDEKKHKAQFYRDLRKELAKWGLITFTALIIGWIWMAFKIEVHK